MYQQLIAQGVRDASLYFNLGNAALNMGQPEAALSYFEDALKLDPRDPDIQANLELTRSLTGIQAATGSANPVIGGLMKIRKSLSRDEIAAASLALWFGLGFMFITITRRRNSRRRIGSERIVLTGLLGLGLLVLGAALGPNIPAS